ncbi:hypothetical protein OSI83_25220, partial [Mycobacterium ulcerans]
AEPTSATEPTGPAETDQPNPTTSTTVTAASTRRQRATKPSRTTIAAKTDQQTATPPGTTLTTKRQTRVGREPDAGTTHATSPTDTEQPRIATNTAGTT